METGLDSSHYKEALIVLGAAGVVIPLVQRFRLSPVLGYILVGMAVGPFGLAALAADIPFLSWFMIADQSAIQPIAHLGVALLMFMIGLELSFERLWLMRRLVFGLGAAQMAVCAGTIGGLTWQAGFTPSEAAVVGVALAMSSTAVVLQVMSDEKRLNTLTGRASFAILLFQDLSVVPVLFVIGALAPDSNAGNLTSFAIAVGQALLAIALIIALGRLVLRPLFRSVARTRSSEFFIAACLLVVIAAGLAAEAAGLSMALGALIGGLLLAGTEYRRQVEVTIGPFKGLLVGVFLISIGMTLDLHLLASQPLLVLGCVCALIVVKAALIAILARMFGIGWRHGLQTGLLLGPGGEFGFVIVTLAVGEHVLGEAIRGIVLLTAALTMTSIPLMSALGRRMTARITAPAAMEKALQPPEADDGQPRVIVAGFGRVGQTVASMLERHAVPYLAIDRDPDRVMRERRNGRPIYYGDMTHTDLLQHLPLATARALVVTLDDPETAAAVVAAARVERQDLLIVARARDARHAASLYHAGASDAVPETIESSLQLSEAVLVDLGVPMGPVIVSIHEKRAELQEGIRAMAPMAEVREFGRYRLRDTLQ